MSDNAGEFSPVAKVLHWWIAGLVLLQFILAKLADRAAGSGAELKQLALLANHKSVGITILVLASVRLAWRTYRPPPPPLPMPGWQRQASQLSHWTLYACLFLMPLTGWLMSSASAFSVSWFNVVQLPDFVDPNPNLKATLLLLHEVLSKVLLVVAAIHIGAALKHAFYDKDRTLTRISSSTGTVVFVIVLIGGIFSLTQVGGGAGDAPSGARSSTENFSPQSSDLPAWRIDYGESFIRFTGVQAGAEFDGEWQAWSADLRFASDAIESGLFDVTVDIASVETGDDSRDETIIDEDWFDVQNYPRAFYRASEFTANRDGSFVAGGEITIRNVRTPVELTFRVVEENGRTILDGSTTLDRLALQLGLGQWTDTEWVGQFVQVTVRVVAI